MKLYLQSPIYLHGERLGYKRDGKFYHYYIHYQTLICF